MREILFRGKRKDNGEWETGSLVMIIQGLSDEQVFITDNLTGVRIPVSPDTIGQYTGLKDKHGKKIFEGDILKIHNNYTGDTHPFNVVVKFRQGAFVCQGISEYEDWYYYFNTWNVPIIWFEIIGNIYDNPELLKGDIGK